MANKETGPEYVWLKDKVEVTASAKDPYHKQGSKYMVHPKQLAYLQKNGLIEKGKTDKVKDE